MTKKTNKKPLSKKPSKSKKTEFLNSILEGEGMKERFDRLSNATFEALVFHHKEKIIDVNLSFTRLFGYNRNEVLGKSIWILPSPEKHTELKKYIQEKNNKPFETLGIRKDGSSFPCEVVGKEMPYKKAKIIVSAIRDISNQIKTREAWMESEERFRVLSESSTEAIFIHNQGVIVAANDVSSKMLGYSKEELIGMTPKELSSPEYHDLIYKKIITQDTNPYQVIALRKDQSKIVVEVKGNKVNYQGKEMRVVCIRDITEEKRMEASLRENEERFRSLFEYAHDLIQSVNPEGKFLYVNKAWLDTLGYTSEELNNLSVFNIIHPDSMSHCQDIFSQILKGKSFKNIEVVFLAKNKSRIIVEGNIHPRYSGQKIIATQALFRDVTEKKEALNKIQKLNEELEQRVRERTLELTHVNQELESFSYSVSHDLRGPLRNIDGFCNILLAEYSEKFDALGQDCLKNIHQSSRKMSILINDLINLSKVSRTDLIKTTINLSGMVESVISEYKQNYPAQKIQFNIQKDIFINGDENLVSIVIENLISNAIKFTSKKQSAVIKFGIMKHSWGDAVFLSDNGAGFDMKLYDRLFCAFQRLHPTTEFEGSGIGLATVKRIIDRHNGKIWANGEVEKGATFYFIIP